MAWFAIAERKFMSPEKEQSKDSQIITDISNILNALGAENLIFFNLHMMCKDWKTK